MTGCQYDPHSPLGPSGSHCEQELSDVIITAWPSNWSPPLLLQFSDQFHRGLTAPWAREGEISQQSVNFNNILNRDLLV